jgi:YD repeat-containing protein
MQFSKSHKHAILSAFPVTLAKARLFEKSNNLTYLCNLEILHSYKRLKQNGNRTSVTQNNVNGSETISYIYDKADRLTHVVYPDITVNYTLDKVGNRKVETIDNGTTTLTKTYSYNNRDQLTGIVGSDGLNNTLDTHL